MPLERIPCHLPAGNDFDQDVAMATAKPLALSQLYKACKASDFSFKTTRDCEPFNDFLGQERAKEAVSMAVALPHDGYNIFAVGTAGLGKRTTIRRYLRELAAKRPAPSDWCYVNNFAEPRYPVALEFAAGKGAELKQDMSALWRDMSMAVIASFDSEQYFERMELLKGELGKTQQDALTGLAGEGEKKGVKLVLRTPGGYGFSPMNGEGEVMSVEDFNALPKKEQDRLKAVMTDMETKLRKVARGLNLAEEQNRS